MATLTLDQYCDLVADIPLPTEQQKENFVDYVSHAHSWYKHLSRYQPGVPFHFFIHRNAGCDCVCHEDGTVTFVERSEEGLHYSDLPTSEYRSRFGYLAFTCSAGPAFVFEAQDGVVYSSDKVPMILGKDARLYGLPPEIVKAGEVWLTAVIHVRSAAFGGWGNQDQRVGRRLEWPEESGGLETVERLVARSRAMKEPGFEYERLYDDPSLPESRPCARKWLSSGVDPVLYELLAAERQRQQMAMIEAIERMCSIALKTAQHRGSGTDSARPK